MGAKIDISPPLPATSIEEQSSLGPNSDLRSVQKARSLGGTFLFIVSRSLVSFFKNINLTFHTRG